MSWALVSGLVLLTACCADCFVLNPPRHCYSRISGSSSLRCELTKRSKIMPSSFRAACRPQASDNTFCHSKAGRIEDGLENRGPVRGNALLNLMILWRWLTRHVKMLALSVLTLFFSMSISLSAAHAASICIPVPTLNGIGHVCMEYGSSESQQIPEHVNPQQTPTNGEGNILSRAGFRPQTMFQEGWARMQAVARWKLSIMEELDAIRASPQPLDSRAVLDKIRDPAILLYGQNDIPRSQIIAGMIDPVIVGTFFSFGIYLLRLRIWRAVRDVCLTHQKARSILIIKAQIALQGNDALQLMQTCQTIARKAAEEIFPIDVDENGLISKEALPENQVLAAAVRYSSMVLLNATRQDVVIERVVSRVFNASEVEKAFGTWESTLEEEEFRGVPIQEFPHRPGEFIEGSWDEKPKPAVAGIALEKRADAFDLIEQGLGDWKEILWMNPRGKAPVEYAMIPPSTRSLEEQEFIEDRRAANQDRVHKLLFNKTGGYLKRLQEVRKRRELPLATAEEWNEANKTGGSMDNSDLYVDIREADFEKLYTEEYGDDWKKDFPEDLKAVKEENLRLIKELKEWYHKERGKNFNTPADVFKFSGLRLRNESSGITLEEDFEWDKVKTADQVMEIMKNGRSGELTEDKLSLNDVDKADMQPSSTNKTEETNWVLEKLDESIRRSLEEIGCLSLFASELHRILQDATNILTATSDSKSFTIGNLQISEPDANTPSIGQILTSLNDYGQQAPDKLPSMIVDAKDEDFSWKQSNDSSLLALSNVSKSLEEFEAELAAQASTADASLPVDLSLEEVVRGFADVGEELIRSCVLNLRWRNNDREKSEKLEAILKAAVKSESFSRIVSIGVFGKDEAGEQGKVDSGEKQSNPLEDSNRSDLIKLIAEAEEIEEQRDDYIIFGLAALGINVSQDQASNLSVPDEVMKDLAACKLMLPKWQWTLMQKNKDVEQRVTLRFFDKFGAYVAGIPDQVGPTVQTMSNDMQRLLEETMDNLEEFMDPDQDEDEQQNVGLTMENAGMAESFREQEVKEREFAIANRAAFGFSEPHCVATLMVRIEEEGNGRGT
eukprot:749450-Hanusia_phi.AAC.4